VKKLIFQIGISLLFLTAQSQPTQVFSGFVKDSTSNEVLIGANVVDPARKVGTATDNFGFFRIELPEGTTTLQVSYVGYSPKNVEVNSLKTVANILLAPENQLDEVVVKSEYSYRRFAPQTSLERMPARTVRTLPSILGETDITRTIQLLPGVAMGTEATSGFFVRGGGSDQNLILVDGTPIYNTYHMFGMFSVFNSDAINGVTFYKGGMPAQHGGRLSSVLDLTMREGNSQRFSGEVMLGTFSSKFLFEGPIAKGKTSFLVTGRRSTLDISPEMMSMAVIGFSGMYLASGDVRLDMYSFYDINAKVNHTFSNRSRLFITLYNGKDDYSPQGSGIYDHTFGFGNRAGSVRFNQIFTENLYGNFMLYYSGYNYSTTKGSATRDEEGNVVSGNSLTNRSSIEDISLKTDFDYGVKNHTLKFGAQYLRQNVSPEVSAFNSVSSSSQYNVDTTYRFSDIVHQASLYVSDIYNPTNKLTLNAGLRFDTYFVEGKIYPTLQPRVTLSYLTFDRLTLKTSYARVSQNLHLLSFTSSGAPSDMWVSSTKKVAPSISNEFVAGLTFSPSDAIVVTLEGFLKRMDNLITYKEGASYAVNRTDWQEMVEVGNGKSKGLEFCVRKETGSTTGWISYTLSKATRQFDGVNRGREFTFNFDRTHNLAVAVMQKLGKRYSLGANWMYATGSAVTLSNIMYYNTGPFDYGYYTVVEYENLNNERMPAYHRLDICLNYERFKKHLGYKFSIGAYNAYAHQNPYYLTQSVEGIGQVSLFGVIPYLSFSLNF